MEKSCVENNNGRSEKRFPSPSISMLGTCTSLLSAGIGLGIASLLKVNRAAIPQDPLRLGKL